MGKFFLCVLLLSLLHSANADVPIYCIASNSSYPCPFNSQCNCVTDDDLTAVLCNVDTSFPLFTSTDLVTISSVTVCGTFSAILDNAFYLLSDMTFAEVSLLNTGDEPIVLTTYDTTFLTQKKYGIRGLTFVGFNPENLTTMTNTDSVDNVKIRYAGLKAVPESMKIFDEVGVIDLAHNQIMSVDTADFNLAKLSLLNLDYNNITTVDPNFENWLNLDSLNSLYLSYNQIPCDPTVQWMADYAFCTPETGQQLSLTGINCPSGGSLLDYLQQFTDCSGKRTSQSSSPASSQL